MHILYMFYYFENSQNNLILPHIRRAVVFVVLGTLVPGNKVPLIDKHKDCWDRVTRVALPR